MTLKTKSSQADNIHSLCTYYAMFTSHTLCGIQYILHVYKIVTAMIAKCPLSRPYPCLSDVLTAV